MNGAHGAYFLPVFSAFLILIFPLSIFAQTNDPTRGKTVILSKDQIIDHDYFAAGDTVTIDGTVNGDAYVAGGLANINGVINGDLLVAGGQVMVAGKVAQDVRAAGGNILIKGGVQRNITLLGGNITIDNDAAVAGNAVVVGVGTMEISPDAVIHGNLDYWSSDEAAISASANVRGKTTFHQTQAQMHTNRIAENAARFASGLRIVSFISTLIVGALLVWLFPVYSQKASGMVREKFWTSFLVGLVALIVTPIIAISLFATVVGIPIASILLFGYGVLLYISKVFVVLAIGVFVSEKAAWKLSPVWAFVAGLLLYYIIGFIPIVGGLTKFAVTLVGVGVILLQKKEYYHMLRKQNLV